MTVGLVLASSCSGVSEDQILVEPNELGVASLTIRSYVEHDEAIFELRALDQHGDEVATFRRAVGAIVDLPQVADADFDASLGTEFTVKTQVLVIMTLLGLLPVLAMMTTSFTRFVIVLSLLRQALGLQSGLPNRIVTGVALTSLRPQRTAHVNRICDRVDQARGANILAACRRSAGTTAPARNLQHPPGTVVR